MTQDTTTTHPSGERAALGAEKRCGTCKRWRPHRARDTQADRWYGGCVAPLPSKAPIVYGVSGPYESSSDAGDNCSAYRPGGKHGDKR